MKHPDLDLSLFENLTMKELMNVNINKHYYKLLDQDFWKKRLEQKYHIMITEMYHYKFLNYFINDGDLNDVFINAAQLYKTTLDKHYLQVLTFIDQYKLRIPDNIVLENDLVIMALWEYYEDYSDELNFARKTTVANKVTLDTIVYGKESLLVIYVVDDEVYEIPMHGRFTVGKILYEWVKQLQDIPREDLYETMNGQIYIQHILWNEDYNGYEIMLQ